MIAKANQEKSQIIALCAVKHGVWKTGYMGSLTCALALNGVQSLLIGKASLRHCHPLRAVLAMDHSSKAEALVQMFLSLRPQGIKEMLIVTAYEIDDETALAAHKNLPMLGGDIDRSLQETFRAKNARLIQILNESGYDAQESVVCGSPTEVLRESMKEFRGDLLIVGATGDGSPAGSKIGSVALHQVVSESYSVLMLRHH